jgi:tetraacyldisaccharide 4'-kinase
MHAPDFWHRDGWLARALSPLSPVYGWAVRRHLEDAEEFRPAIPVICVGNIIAGGAGKTPVVVALARLLKTAGRQVHLLTRGYGGTEVGPRAVDLDRHDAARVGDEALLLASEAPTWVARWRPDGAAATTAMGADIIVMDDGFQNGSLSKDLSLVVVDGSYGFGNGRVMPAGPCRESPAHGLRRADAVVLMGEDSCDVSRYFGDLPVLHAHLRPGPEAEALHGREVIAFAGIGRPGKFFATLDSCGASLVATQDFPDHHPYSRAEIEELLAEAEAAGALLATTAKDAVRIPADLRRHVTVVTVALEWSDHSLLARLLDRVGVVVP